MVTVYLFDYPNTCKYIWSHYVDRFTILYQWQIQVESGFMLEDSSMDFNFKDHILRFMVEGQVWSSWKVYVFSKHSVMSLRMLFSFF
jgi:hypothetical protein